MLQQSQCLHFCLHTDGIHDENGPWLSFFSAVFRIRIRMFFDLPDPDPSLLVRIRMNPNLVPDQSINEQKKFRESTNFTDQ